MSSEVTTGGYGGKWPLWVDCVLAGALLMAATLGRMALDRFWGDNLPFITYFAVILVIVWRGHWALSCGAIAASGLLAKYFFMSPRYTLQIPDSTAYVSLAAFLLVCMAFLFFAQHARRAVGRLQQSIAERESWATQLKRSEERFRRLVELSSETMWVTDAHGQPIATLAKGGEQIREPDGNCRPNWLACVHAEDRASVETAWKKSLAEERTFEVECRIQHGSGEYRHMSCRAVPVPGPDGAVREWVGMNSDITDRKLAAERMRNLASFPEDNPNPVLRVGEDGVLWYGNPAAKALLEEWGAKGGDLVPDHVHHETRRALDTGSMAEWDEACGDKVYAFMVAPLPDREYANIYARDITERKESEERLRFLTESIPHMVWAADANGNCQYLNQRFITYLAGQPRGKDYGEWMHAAHPEDELLARSLWKHALDSGEEFRLELRLRNGDTGQYRWFYAHALPRRDREGRILRWHGTCTDVHERRQATEGLQASQRYMQELNQELETRVAERTEMLRQTAEDLNAFVYAVAHDLRAPLRTQLGFGRILLTEHAQQMGEEGRQCAQRVVQAAERLNNILHDLMAYVNVSRAELPVDVIDVRNVIAQAQADLAIESAGANAAIDGSAVQPQAVLGNRSALHLIVLNLLTNACKFVAPGVSPNIRLRTELRGENTRLWIEDNGIGIAPEHVGKLFGVFQRLHAQHEYPGTGLGLANVKKAADRMGWSVGVESEVGKGSRFWVELPNAALDPKESVL
jgi:PAS domain S-box-containing protein